MADPESETLTRIVNTLGVRLEQIDDPRQKALTAHAIGTLAREVDEISGTALRAAVTRLREQGLSHAEVATLLGVSRSRAQTLVGLEVKLAGGPKDGEVLTAVRQRNGRPNRQLLVAVSERGVANYWRRRDPEPDGGWVADFYPGTRTPPDFTDDLVS